MDTCWSLRIITAIKMKTSKEKDSGHSPYEITLLPQPKLMKTEVKVDSTSNCCGWWLLPVISLKIQIYIYNFGFMTNTEIFFPPQPKVMKTEVKVDSTSNCCGWWLLPVISLKIHVWSEQLTDIFEKALSIFTMHIVNHYAN